MTQLEKLFARIKWLCNENPSRALHLTIIVDEKKEPLLWISQEVTRVEGRQEEKPKDEISG